MTTTPRPTPENACDCHIHIYDTARFPLSPKALSTPPPARWQDYVTNVQQQIGTSRAVIVQATGYALDNRCTLDALAQSAGAARAIVTIEPETPMAELQRLDSLGVRGVRFMLVPGGGGALEWSQLEPMAAKIADLGWVINLQLDGRDLPQYLDRLRALPCRLSIDHNGKFLVPVAPEDAAFQALLRLVDEGNTWVKLSAPYETSRVGAPGYGDVSVLASALVRANPERCLWASNYPHPGQKVVPSEKALLDLLGVWAPSAVDQQRILVSNPEMLYRL
ncbi:amidohydrolase family protein [Xylophilus rhododendri]|uniref:Amidohydrolase family protein n=1 Tax=Xylophilus rhododendri TaxID=2697032 RepID=A0A857J6N9_9BURK|nr:amidohydrolase family protein [Xylophilus rhododendri]QHI98458.1 amidohydrolase family protein [Xylophilus rhododendri]